MKDIQGYEGLYAITSCGKIWSYYSKRFLSLISTKDGYLKINLYKDGKKKTYQVHRLVGEAYIPNPEGLPQINHINECKTDNYLNNLEWCDAKYNINYGTHTEKCAATRKKRNAATHTSGKSVYCVELDRTFGSIKEAAEELGVNRDNVSKCINGKRKTCGGYHWKIGG